MMIKCRQKLYRGGFTLFEVLVYIALFSLIISAVVGLAILATGQRQKDEVVSVVDLQGESIMSLVTQTIHDATSIISPALGSSANSLTLAMPAGSSNPTTFNSYNDGSTTRLEIAEGASPAVTNYLTNSHVILSNLVFSNEGLTGTSGSILISFTLTYINLPNWQVYNYQKTFYGAATIP